MSTALNPAVAAGLDTRHTPHIAVTPPAGRRFGPVAKALWAFRRELLWVLVFSMFVLGYAIYSQGTPIYEMVSGAYQVTLVGSFVPLVFGLYWRKASTQGAIVSIVLGLLTWLLFLATPLGVEFPAQLAGVLASLLGMVAGSLTPQAIRNSYGSHHRLVST